MEGHCDCGAVRITIPQLPDTINACPCAFCRRAGAHWGYYSRESVSVEGETQIYRRASRKVAFHRCTVCGVLTDWTKPDGRMSYMGVHMKNFDPALVADVPVVVKP